jgi:hypothetical protein
MLDHLYDPPVKTLLLIGCLSALFYFLSWIMSTYEYIMNFYNPTTTNLFNEGPIGYSILASMGVCVFFWVKLWFQLPSEIKAYSLIESNVLSNSTYNCGGGEKLG